MKSYKVLLLALGALLLAGCSLARAEENGAASQMDRWIGFYAVSLEDYRAFHNNPHLTEYGSSQYKTDQFGSITLPDRVLFAEETEEGYVFPDLPGYRLFLLWETLEDGSACVSCVSDMGPGDDFFSRTATSSGTENFISGTLYEGPPAGVTDWDPSEDYSIWTAYRVFQTPDGRIYLNGSGNSYAGGMSGFTETQTYSYTMDGETMQEDKLTVKVYIKSVPRLEKVIVTQYDSQNIALRSDDLALREEIPEIICETDTVWVLVEEVNTDGTIHTAYDVPAGGTASHNLVLLDDAGLGTAVTLTIGKK